MNAKKVLFPTDFSEYSEAALAFATSISRDTDAALVIVHVKESPEAFVDAGFAGYPVGEERTEILEELNSVKPTDPDVAYSHKLLAGEPAVEIVRCAEEEGADMIIMGTHGRGGLMRVVMGSVAEAVVRMATCPVLTIKQPSKKAAGAQ